MWSGPRNVSTAMMYSFAQRPDCKVWDEPLYGYYLKKTGVHHPGHEQILKQMEVNGPDICKQMIERQFKEPILFIKNMAHHLTGLDRAFIYKMTNILLIRDPEEMLPSLIQHVPKPTLRDTGLQSQWQVYSELIKVQDPLVIDSKRFLSQPREMLHKICIELAIPFYDDMLHWRRGPIREDGVWSKYWYQQIHLSSGFKPYKKKKEGVPKFLEPLLEDCNQYYHKLLKHAL